MKSSLKNMVVVLFSITLIASLCVGLVNKITFEPIEKAKAENIQVTEEELEKELTDMAAAYQMEADKLKELIGDKEKEQIKADIAVQKAVDLVVAAAKEA